jgi:hypothetical protein
MKWIVTLLIACSVMLPFRSVLADETTAPGQQKKEAGDGSAKEYAPGQDKDSAAGAKEKHHAKATEQKKHHTKATEEKKHHAKATKEKQHHAKAKSDKAKAGAKEATPSAPVAAPKEEGKTK